MKNVSDVTALVVDHGLFLPVARRLAREMKKVYYFSPSEKAFPSVREVIGDGFPEIERVSSIWSVKEHCDLFIFPDVGFADEQEELISQGFPVWGARGGSALEEWRGQFLKALEQTELPIPPHRKVVGMDALRNYLVDKRDKWVKISKFRGDWETLHFRSWEDDETELDARAVRLGPWKDLLTFYVFDEIETKVEDGCDAYCIDGKFPSLVIHGFEAKDKAYLGTFQRYDELPEEVRCVSDAFGPILAGYDYRGFCSTEVRITEEGESYFIDPTLRAGSPPSQVMCEMIGNLGSIIWHGAHGELEDPEPAYKFGVQGLLCMKDRQVWRALTLPEDMDRWVKCGFCCKIGDSLWFPPDPEEHGGQVGWLIGVGDTPQEAIEHLRVNAEALPCGVHCEFEAIADLIKEVDEAEKEGMEFTDQPMPEPEIVLKENG